MTNNVEMSNDEGAAPSTDFKNKNQDTAAGSADSKSDDVHVDDPDKVHKLAKAGRPDFDPDAGSD